MSKQILFIFVEFLNAQKYVFFGKISQLGKKRKTARCGQSLLLHLSNGSEPKDYFFSLPKRAVTL